VAREELYEGEAAGFTSVPVQAYDYFFYGAGGSEDLQQLLLPRKKRQIPNINRRTTLNSPPILLRLHTRPLIHVHIRRRPLLVAREERGDSSVDVASGAAREDYFVEHLSIRGEEWCGLGRV
jgi:hypothetical protein